MNLVQISVSDVLVMDEVKRNLQILGAIQIMRNFCSDIHFPAGIYLLEVNIRDTRTRCEIYLKLVIKTVERRHWRRYSVFIVNFEHISHLVLVFLLLTLIR